MSVAIAMALIVCAFLDLANYLHLHVDAFAPKYLYFAFAAVVAALVLARGAAAFTALRVPFIAFALTFVALNLGHVAVAASLADNARSALILSQTQFLVLAALLASLFTFLRPLEYARVFPPTMLALVVLVVLDFLAPGTLYPLDTEGAVLGRGGGTFVNPNRAGEAILLALLLGLPALGPLGRELCIAAAGVGIVLTLSRAMIIAWLLLWVYLVLSRRVSRFGLMALVAAALLAPALIVSLEGYLGAREDLAAGADNIHERLDFFKTRDLGDESAQERKLVLDAGLELFAAHPVLGAGAASTHVWTHGVSTHNTPVLLAAEYGLVGLMLWLALLVLVWRGEYFRERALQAAAVIGVLFLSVFTHNMLDSLYWLLAFALLGSREIA